MTFDEWLSASETIPKGSDTIGNLLSSFPEQGPISSSLKECVLKKKLKQKQEKQNKQTKNYWRDGREIQLSKENSRRDMEAISKCAMSSHVEEILGFVFHG